MSSDALATDVVACTTAAGLPASVRPVRVAVEGLGLERYGSYLRDGTHGVVAVEPDEGRLCVDLVLWSPNELDKASARAAIVGYRPTPVFVILTKVLVPTSRDIAQYLRAGAHQCLIEPNERELVAYLHATVRYNRF